MIPILVATLMMASPMPQQKQKPHPNFGDPGTSITVAGLVTDIQLTSLAIWPQNYGTDGHYHAHSGPASVQAEVYNDSNTTIQFYLTGTWTETKNARNGGGTIVLPVSTLTYTVGPYGTIDVPVNGVPTDPRVRGGDLKLTLNKVSGGPRVPAIGNDFAVYICTGMPAFQAGGAPKMYVDLLYRITDACDFDASAADVAADSAGLINYFGNFSAYPRNTPFYYSATGGAGGNGSFNLKQFLQDDANATATMDSWDTAALLQVCMGYEGWSSAELELFQAPGGVQFETVPIIAADSQAGPQPALLNHEAVMNFAGGIYDPWYSFTQLGQPPVAVGDPEPYWQDLVPSVPAPVTSYYVGVTTAN